ncbi:membrane protein YdbS with pleckstrin-like domain [Crossiella equi]|uniref:Membrane protein YdbS with pleckstrin-like domain n=1 Tax=Crossiella equi TaxID=130796 RepID=A0ABS5ABL4_9PSEU|nr:PH domain-containing protein [Crossiella equi]MBP2473966.1 membrane protein YdbS with pleckstrin-like domain [Crossiella equi]
MTAVREPLRLRPPRYRVDPAARRWWTVQALCCVTAPAFVVAGTMATLSLLFFPGALFWLGPLLLGVLVLPSLGYLLVMPPWRYRVHAWELGERAVYSASGWFWQRRRITPLGKVQTVDTEIGPLQRRYGLATVIVTTASTAGDVRVEGLAQDEADELARRIGEAAEVEEA